MTKFYDSDSEARWWVGITGRIMLGLLLFGVLAVILTLGTLGWRYVFAGPTGKVQKQEIIQNGTNQLTQQAEFEQLNADITAYGQKIVAAHEQAQAHPDDQRYQTIELGLVNTCNDAVAKYNALARTERAEAFRAADLPESINARVACAQTR